MVYLIWHVFSAGPLPSGPWPSHNFQRPWSSTSQEGDGIEHGVVWHYLNWCLYQLCWWKITGLCHELMKFQKKLSNMPSLFPLLEGRPLEGGRKSASTHQRPWSNMVTVYISISIHVGISYTGIFWKVWTCLYPNHFFDLLSLLPSNLNLIESIIVCLISISTPAHNVN